MSLYQITKAVEFATTAHTGIKRKYSGEPYITHPIAVANIVASFGGDTEQVIAAYLHDTVEDVAHITHKIIGANFGSDVESLVHGMTKDNHPNNVKRVDKKKAEAIRLAATDGRVQTIKCADIIHNCGTIIQHDIKFGALYLDEANNVLRVMVNAAPSIRVFALAMVAAEQAKLKVLQRQGPLL